ncbi:DUF5694 domain-containing protein [Roseibacterium beibuensis]|nr:DUF5694 domain-containing protein [Roseibacterium beibuensis]
MKRILAGVVGALALGGNTAVAQPAADHVDAAETSCMPDGGHLLILGVYHMDNPGLDAENLRADDVLSDRRQREIDALARALVKYRPSKVAVEAPYGDRVWPSRYLEYLQGQRSLGRNEIEQVGFRVARTMGHNAIYPIDYPMFMSGLRHDEVERRPPSQPSEGASPSADEARLSRSTVTEFLIHLNDPGRIATDHAAYMGLLAPDSSTTALYERVDRLTFWYQRNHRMMANLVRVSEPGDRVLLVVGAGHLQIMRDLARDAPFICLMDTQKYLQEAALPSA